MGLAGMRLCYGKAEFEEGSGSQAAGCWCPEVPVLKLLPEFLGHNGTFPSHDPFFSWAPRVLSHARYVKCSQICALKFPRDELPRVIAVMDNTAMY